MFRRVASSASRFAVLAIGGVGGGQLAAALVAPSPQQQSQPVKTPLTDKELNKKPYWYKEAVHELEDVLKKLSQYSPIEVDISMGNLVTIFSQSRCRAEIYSIRPTTR